MEFVTVIEMDKLFLFSYKLDNAKNKKVCIPYIKYGAKVWTDANIIST